MVYAPSSTTCETSSAMRKMFNAADKNGDGGLSEQEFQAYMQNNLKRSSLGGAGTAFQDLFDQIDANDDQMIDFEEFKKQLPDRAEVLIEDEIPDERGTRFTLVGKL